MKRTRGASNNPLLQKDDVGRPKPNTRRLPPETFAFGKKEIRDIEDAGMVASKWDYHQMSMLKRQDKDFKSLNKSALAQKATTAHRQYEFRQMSDIRMKHPSEMRNYTTRPKTCQGGRAPRIDIETLKQFDHSYGLPLRPGTPIKAVLGNFYGELSGYQHQVRKKELDKMDCQDRERLANPPRGHTRASAMANQFINTRQSVERQSMTQPSQIFKMRKFLAVKPKVTSQVHKHVK